MRMFVVQITIIKTLKETPYVNTAIVRTVKEHGMIEALQEQMQQSDIYQLSFDERFSLLIERECITRENRKLTSRLRQARLKANACIEDIDYSVSRGISRAVIKQLADCSWVGRKQNLLITGPTGTGKTWLACALANSACRKNFTARYLRLPRLFQTLELARGDGVILSYLLH